MNEKKETKSVNKKRALYFTLWFYSFLVWVYVSLRIIVSRVSVTSLFIDAVPVITFLDLGVLSFLVSAFFMYLFLKEETYIQLSP